MKESWVFLYPQTGASDETVCSAIQTFELYPKAAPI